ncbi:aldo/keto reductase [Streptomyces sp. 150FB]|jgi:aryl-alcohol dehydrogenase-like predicted oxidoreductase|uniref:aldo/keto reductase n=1 Tax=Streptomyces sp. 150FB TaxID=1576605 RepID=UPI0005896B1F|nr:aldo/keto reductase [Streptomyces sp. 150FB]KIF72864.1 aldo/keto reductase [Streptomyces sp. 150FB]
MLTRHIGTAEVSAVGLGAMNMSIEGRPDEARSIATIHAAIDAGVNLIDTADSYHLAGHDEIGHNEKLIAKALSSHSRGSEVLVSTKGGHMRPDLNPGPYIWVVNGRPEHIKAACEGSLKRLGVEAIGLYFLHRTDKDVPYADSVGAIGDLLDAGKIRMAGISNADPAQIEFANDALGGRLVAVQNQFSPGFRSSEPELERCDALGIAFMPWAPIRGLSASYDGNPVHDRFARVAQAHGVSPQQVSLAWMLAKSPMVIPIPGSTRPETVRDSAAAVDLVLDDAELRELDTV